MASNGRSVARSNSRRTRRTGGESTRWLKDLPSWFWGLAATVVLLHVVLIAIGGYGWGIISRLHLPVSNFVSFLAVILPVGNLVAVGHALVQSSGHASPLKHVRWNLFVTLITILDAVLVTLAATHLDAESLACPLQGNWSKMFQAKDGKHIQQIQDALNCCGFKTVKDMPFPFPHGKDQLMQCADTNNRDTACFEPWRKREQVASTLYVIVGTVLGLVKVISMIYLNRKTLINPDHKSSTLSQSNVHFADESDTEGDEHGNSYQNGSRRQIGGPAAGAPPTETTNLLDDSEYEQDARISTAV